VLSNIEIYWGIRDYAFMFEKTQKKNFQKMSMAIFHFPKYEQELFYRYWDRLHAYLAQCDSCGYLCGKWKILHVVDKSVNCETHTLFEYWDFYAKNVDEAWDFLDWLA